MYGVCGCEEFWARALPGQLAKPVPQATPTISTAHEHESHTLMQRSADMPTCFFWYHGQCRRESCQYEHSMRPTLPILPPPGFVHSRPCQLPLCPLREGNAAADQANNSDQQLGDQADGVPLNRASQVLSPVIPFHNLDYVWLSDPAFASPPPCSEAGRSENNFKSISHTGTLFRRSRPFTPYPGRRHPTHPSHQRWILGAKRDTYH